MSSMLDAVCDVWGRYRGLGHEVDCDKTVDSRSKMYVALWERSHWLVESSVLMRMHPDFDSTRSTADVGMLFALCSEYFVSRKRHRYLLRLEIKSLNRVLNEAVSTRMPDGPAPALDPELCFEPSVHHCPLVGHAWLPSSPEWFADLSSLETLSHGGSGG